MENPVTIEDKPQRNTWLSKLKCNNCGNRWFEPIERGKKIIDTPNGIVLMSDGEDATNLTGKLSADIWCHQCNCKSTITKDIERMNNYVREKKRERDEQYDYRHDRDQQLVSATDYNRDRDFNSRGDFNTYRSKKPYYRNKY